MRVDESWRSNASESCNSHQLSSPFDRAYTLLFSLTVLLAIISIHLIVKELKYTGCIKKNRVNTTRMFFFYYSKAL